MGIFKKLGKFLTPPADSERALYLYVQCNKCGEKLRARVDRWNELTAEYDEKNEKAVAYTCRKVLIGENKCFQQIELRLKFDKNHKLTDKEITGGKFIGEADFNR